MPPFAVASAPVEPDIASPSRELRVVLVAADQAQTTVVGGLGVGILTSDVRDALDRADAGTLDGWGVKALTEAIDRAAEAALGPGVASLQAELDWARAELEQALGASAAAGAACGRSCVLRNLSAQHILDAAVAALRTAPPAGVGAEYVDAFVGRNRSVLLAIVAAVARKAPLSDV